MAELLKNATLSHDIVWMGETPEAPLPPLETKETQAIDYETAFAAGVAHENNRLTVEAESIAALLESIPKAISEHRFAQHTEITSIVLLMAEQLFIHQRHDKEAIGRQITDILKEINTQQSIRITLHPHDYALLNNGEINVKLSHLKQCTLIPDERLTLGGCVVQTENGVFDGGIERQIERLKQALLL